MRREHLARQRAERRKYVFDRPKVGDTVGYVKLVEHPGNISANDRARYEPVPARILRIHEDGMFGSTLDLEVHRRVVQHNVPFGPGGWSWPGPPA